MADDSQVTNAPSLRSWLESANQPDCDFPIQNLPYAIFRRTGAKEGFRGGVAIGDQILDLGSDHLQKCLEPPARVAAQAANAPSLNALMSMGRSAQSALRADLSRVLQQTFAERVALRPALVPMNQAEFDLPARIGDFADFYSSFYHARNVGALLRPQNPILPNYSWLPVGYHGRTSTIAVSGNSFVRPCGQTLPAGETSPQFGACQRLDYEAELGIFIGERSAPGRPVPIDTTDRHLFGMCLLNDWSARDIQTWEYQPLGPFLAKSFATTISPWVVTFDALEPFRTGLRRPTDMPPPLPHLISKDQPTRAALDIRIEVSLLTAAMKARGELPALLSSSTYADTFWSLAQLVTHYTSGGSGLEPGDLLGSGTVSGPSPDARACLLEITGGGKDPVVLPNGEQRAFLRDGDTVILRAHCGGDQRPRIGFGECWATVLPALTQS